MKTLHWYLIRQVLAALVMTVAVFTFVLLLGNVLKEVLGLLVSGQVRLKLVGAAVGLLIPYVLVFALPMGLLTATLLVFGRCSADNELTAARGSGISLIALVTPVIVLSLFFSVLSASINMYVGPKCRVAYKQLLLSAGLERAASALPEKVFIKDFKNLIVYIGEVDGDQLKDILIYTLEEGKVKSYVRAASGQLSPSRSNIVTGILRDAWQIEVGQPGEDPQMIYFPEAQFTHTNQMVETELRVQISDKTFWELCDELNELEGRIMQPGQPRTASLAEMTLPVLMELHRQTSFSFACVAFTLVGIPLGIRAHRRETTIGVAIAIMLVAVYYSFYALAESMDKNPRLYPYLWLWVPNFLFEAVGAILLWRSNRAAW